MNRRFVWCGFLTVLLAASSASAQAKKPRRVIKIDALTIEGKVQKPQAFLLLQRSNLNFEELERNESFVPQVLKSVDKAPF